MRDLLDKLTSIESTQESLTLELGDSIGFSFTEDLEIVTEVVGFTEDGIVVELDDIGLDHLTENGSVFLDGELGESLDEARGPCWVGYKQVGMKNKGGKQVPNCVKEDDESLESQVAQILKRFDENMNEIGGYGDPDQSKIVALLSQGDVEGAVEEVWYAYADQDGGELRNMDSYIEDLEDQFADLAQGSKYGSVDEAEYRGKNVPLGKKLPGDVKKSKVYVRKPNGNIVKVNFGDKKMRIKKSNPARRKSFRARHNCKNPGPRWKARYWSCRSW